MIAVIIAVPLAVAAVAILLVAAFSCRTTSQTKATKDVEMASQNGTYRLTHITHANPHSFSHLDPQRIRASVGRACPIPKVDLPWPHNRIFDLRRALRNSHHHDDRSLSRRTRITRCRLRRTAVTPSRGQPLHHRWRRFRP